MYKARRGEIATLVVIGTLLTIGISSILSSYFLQKQQILQTKALTTPRNDAIVEGAPCSEEGEWRVRCTNDRGPCSNEEGVAIPFRCESGVWINTNPYGECNTSCKVVDTIPQPGEPINNICTQAARCIYSERGFDDKTHCYRGYCTGALCGFNEGCSYVSTCSVADQPEVTCPGSNTPLTPTPQPTKTPIPTPTLKPTYSYNPDWQGDTYKPEVFPSPTPTPPPIPTPTYTYNPDWQGDIDKPQVYPTLTPTDAPLPTNTPAPIAGTHVVILDPGHGNPDLDPQEYKSPEGRLNLIIARQTAQYLANQGVETLLSHQSNLGVNSHYGDLQKRADVINELTKSGGEVFVSIHFDSGDYGFRGPRSYYNTQRPFSGQNKRLAELVSSRLSTRTQTAIGGIGSPNIDLDQNAGGCCGPLYILGPQGVRTIETKPESTIKRATEVPGILSEYFSRGLSYESIANNPSLIDQIALGYCDGILLYLENRVCN